MPSCLAAAWAFFRSREAMPRNSTPLALSIAGLTFSMPINAVLTTPQTTGFMSVLLYFGKAATLLPECEARPGDTGIAGDRHLVFQMHDRREARGFGKLDRVR